jgi:hypothetical protein
MSVAFPELPLPKMQIRIVDFGFWILDFGLPEERKVGPERRKIQNPKSKIQNPSEVSCRMLGHA